jgi:hypothetical protein
MAHPGARIAFQGILPGECVFVVAKRRSREPVRQSGSRSWTPKGSYEIIPRALGVMPSRMFSS